MRPLINREAIEARLDAVTVLMSAVSLREELSSVLKEIGDVERIVGRIALRRATIPDYRALLNLVQRVPLLKEQLSSLKQVPLIELICSKISHFHELQRLLEAALNSDETKDWLIGAGYSTELDRLRNLLKQGAQAIAVLERQEQQKSGINSLKIRYSQNRGLCN